MTLQDFISSIRIPLREIKEQVWPDEGIVDSANMALAYIARRTLIFTALAEYEAKPGKSLFVKPPAIIEILSATLGDEPLSISKKKGSAFRRVYVIGDSLRLSFEPIEAKTLSVEYLYIPTLELANDELFVPPYLIEALTLGTLYHCAKRESGEFFVKKIGLYKELFSAEVRELELHTKKISSSTAAFPPFQYF